MRRDGDGETASGSRAAPIVLTARGLRVVQTLAAVAVAALVTTAAALGGSSAGPAVDSAWRSLPAAEGLAAAPCPDAGSVPSLGLRPDKLAAAREGEFSVFGPEPTRLEAPVDWTADPLGANRYRQNLQKLRYLEPLLASYADGGDADDLAAALAIGLDWIASNPRGGPNTPNEAWSDKIVGDRVPYLGYLGRAAACEGLLSARDAELLLDSMSEHGAFLSDDANYPVDNHGLFVDIGLVRLGELYPFAGPADRWRELARERFERTLTDRLSEGVWLEHSTSYEFLAIRAVEDFLGAYGEDAELDGLLGEMRSAAVWFIEPDGRPTQFGDSDIEPTPEWADAGLASADGMRIFPGAGFGFVNADGDAGERGYLAVTTGFHNLTHKHADELSFELFDRGLRIASDTGLYHKDPGPEREFVVSSRAHSTLTVDGLSFPIDDESAAYGSGIEAWGEAGGWYAIEARNPLVEGQGVEHSRTFLYHPNEALIVIDEVASDAAHEYTRYLQLGPQTRVERDGDGYRLDPVDGFVTDAGVRSSSTEVRGSEETPQGLTSPGFREWKPRPTVAWVDSGADRLSAMTIGLSPEAPSAVGVERSGDGLIVELDPGGGELGLISIQRDDESLVLSGSG